MFCKLIKIIYQKPNYLLVIYITSQFCLIIRLNVKPASVNGGNFQQSCRTINLPLSFQQFAEIKLKFLILQFTFNTTL
jgi:hypothetical protein